MPSPPHPGSTSGRSRFPIALGGVAILAGIAVVGGWSPRFSGSDSVLAYTMIFMSAASLEAFLGVVATQRKQQFRDALFALDVLIASAQMMLAGPTGELPEGRGSDLPMLAHRVHTALAREGETSVWLQLDSGRYFPLEVPSRLTADSPQLETLEAMVRVRKALQRAAPEAWERAAGPLVACVIFAGIAGALLPYSVGAAMWAPSLNAGVLLFLVFGSVPLAVWCATSITIAPKAPLSPAGQMVPREKVWVLDLRKAALYPAPAPEAELSADESLF